MTVVALDYDVAHTMQSGPRHIVPDMPDRIIAAMALHLNLPLVMNPTHKCGSLSFHLPHPMAKLEDIRPHDCSARAATFNAPTRSALFV